MKINEFTFRAVGQGLFYTGTLLNNKYNFVYDCGTEDKQRLLRKRIDDYVSKMDHDNQFIEFAVISHLHYDHFSGIQYLDSVAPIKKIYLPYMGKDQNLIALILANAVSTSDMESTDSQTKISVFNFVLNLYSDRNEREVVFIGREEDMDYELGVAVKSQLACADSETDLYWEFLFFNNPLSMIELKKYSTKIEDYIRISGIIDFKSHVEAAISRRDFKEIKNIYTYVFGSKNINSTSISMLHHPIIFTDEVRIRQYDDSKAGALWCTCDRCYSLNEKNIERIPNVSLLTGDAEFDTNTWSYMERFLPKKKKELLIAQVPHHGSYANWHAMELCRINCNRYVIPFGFGNKYKHPGSATIESLARANREIYLATQIHSLEYIIITEK